jgi:tetratricopeptide (TPR) repeat protein
VALPLTSLGAIAWRAGNLDDAEAAFAEALPRFRAVEDRRNTTQVLTNLGYVALARGQLAPAHAILLESFAFGREHSDRFNLPACLRGFGWIAYERGDPARATRLVAAAEAWTADTGTLRWPAERLGGPDVTQDLRQRVAPAAFTGEWAAGQRLTLAQLLEEITDMK